MNKKISYTQTNIIKGIAILLVLLGHLNIVDKGGCYGVTLFLFISGYGLMCSYKKNGLFQFWKKRIKGVWIPYLLITILWIVIDYFLGIKYNLTTIFSSLFGLNNIIDITMWYIKYLIYWYLLFYLIFKYVKNNSFKIISLMISAIFCFLLCKIDFFAPYSEGAIYFIFFPLGVIYKFFENYFETTSIKYNFDLPILILFLVIVKRTDTISIVASNLFFSYFIIKIVLINDCIKNNFLIFLGNISYEIYLLEGVFLIKYVFIRNYISNDFLYVLVYILFVIILAYLYHKLINLICNFRSIKRRGSMRLNTFCTVFTPTYNRKDFLSKLYDSLLKQSFKDFEWVIVDDGSTDNTKEYIEKIIAEKKIKINYYYQKNSGKHVAINNGLKHAKGKVFAIVDSDDYLTKNALLKIKTWFDCIEKCNANIKFCGVSGQKGYSENESVGQTFKGDYIDAKTTDRKKYNINGDKFEVFYTSILKQNQFPVFKGEKFMPETVVWNRLSRQDYYIRWFQDIIYICDYLEDGLTKGLLKHIENSPKGYALNIKEQVKYDNISFKQKMSYYSLYYLVRKNHASLKDIALELETSPYLILVSNVIRKIYKGVK